MKYLTDYIEKPQSILFDRLGVFFAFSTTQFNEAKKEGTIYVNMRGGMVCPEPNVPNLINGLDDIYKKGIAQDIKDNTIEGIIKRELYNHEAFYTYCIDSTFDVLEDYDITKDQIQEVFNDELAKKD